MANAARVNDVDVVLLEEQVETGLRELLDSYRPTYSAGGAATDELDKQFTFNPSRPLPLLSHAYAEAFEATDKTNPDRQLYAMVCTPDLPYRLQPLIDATGFTNPNLTIPIAHGTVRCSHLGESRFVIIFERPQGAPISQLIATQSRVHETKVISHLIGPACAALVTLRERKSHHGNIRPEAFFIGETSILGEPFSAPSGSLNHIIYHSSERLMADPMGYGVADEKSDVYALGVMAFELMYGLEKFKALPRQELITLLLTKGSYQLFCNNRDFPPAIQDFFRGVLTDNIADRWGLDQLVQFIDGKRFNMIAPSPPKDATRPFVFMEESLFSRRLLAHRLHQNWKDSVKDIRGLNLDRWAETSLHRPEVAESIERALRLGSDRSATAREISDMMTRIFIALDPVGPLRGKSLSVRPDAIPLMLATLVDSKEPELPQLLQFIENDISTFWSDQAPSNKNVDISNIILRLQRAKTYLKMNALGFGIERVLYELNPSLPCQSPLLKPYHVTTAAEALSTLDVLAKNRTGEHSFIDRHLAGFLAAKIEMRKQIRLEDSTSIDALLDNQELVMMRILAKAQQKNQQLKLVGLCAWMGMHIERMMGEIHNRVIRKRQKLKLKKRAASGYIDDVLASLLNRDIGDRDADGFVHALALHEINHKRIQFLKNPKILEYKSRKLGGKMALMISYTALTLMVFHVLNTLFGV